LKPTDDPLDVAIDGNGFFKLNGPEGLLYSRRGDFAINGDGLLTTSDGLPVLDTSGSQINIPDIDGGKVAFGDDGTIYVLDRKDNREEVAKLAIVDIKDKSKLKKAIGTTFSLQNGAEESTLNDNYRIIQGSLELSNVNTSSEMAKLIDNHRIFETYHKLLKSYSTISEQQDELGTIA